MTDIPGLAKVVQHLSFFLSIDTESIKFRSSSQVWWAAKFLNLAKGKNIRDGPSKLFTRSCAEAC